MLTNPDLKDYIQAISLPQKHQKIYSFNLEIIHLLLVHTILDSLSNMMSSETY